MWSQVEQALNQSAANVMAGVVRLLPGALALLVSLIVAAVLSQLVRAVLRRTLAGVDFDRRMASWGWSELAIWSGMRSPTLLVSRVVSWTILFLGFVVGIAALDPALTSQVALRLFGSAINLLTALVLLVAGSLLARFLARSVLINLVNMNVQQALPLSVGVKWLVLIVSTAMALEHLSIGGRIVELAFGILFGGVVLALALAVGLRSKDIAEWSMGRRSKDLPAEERQPFDHL
jgi:hypothetical protein